MAPVLFQYGGCDLIQGRIAGRVLEIVPELTDSPPVGAIY